MLCLILVTEMSWTVCVKNFFPGIPESFQQSCSEMKHL